MQDILRMFDIAQKFIILVTDSGSNMKRAANLMNIQNHLCLGHALHNLVTVDGIQGTEEVLELIDKCKKIVKRLRYRAPQLEAAAYKEHRELLSTFETIGLQLFDLEDEVSTDDTQNLDLSSISNPPTIKTSTPTRWHSILMMLSSITHISNRRPIRDMLIDIGCTNLVLDENEFHLITALTKFLDKFKTIVEILSADTETTINLALVFKSEIRRLLDECDDNEPVVITRLKNNMSAKLDHRFPASDMIITATLLDCRFHSIKEIDTCMEMENRDTTKVAFLTKFVKTILKEDDVSHFTQDVFPQPSTSRGSQTNSNFLMDLAKKHSSAATDTESAIENECWKYFSTATVNDLQRHNGNLLEYWKDRRYSFPWLASLARAVLFVPATSTPSERVFSVAGQIITAKRSRLNPLRVNRIIFIHENYSQMKDDI